MTESERIKKIIETLISNRIVRNEAEFCKILPYASGNLAGIKNGTRRIPVSLSLLMEEKFNVNRSYLSGDSNEMFLKKEEPAELPEDTTGRADAIDRANAVIDRLLALLEKQLEKDSEKTQILKADLEVFRQLALEARRAGVSTPEKVREPEHK